jgi:hypothetical protein
MVILFSVPSMAQNKLAQLYVGYLSNCTPLAQWTSQDISDLTHANGFIVLPINYHCGSDSQYMQQVLTTLQTVKSGKPNANVWISTPGFHGTSYFTSNAGTGPFLLSLKSQVSSLLGTSYWQDRVKGIYLYDEGLQGTLSSSNTLSQYVLNVRAKVDSFYNLLTTNSNNYKELVWAPYWLLENGPSLAKVISTWMSFSNDHIAAGSPYPLFDSIMIQSNLVLKAGSVPASDQYIKQLVINSSLDHIRYWASNQHINGAYPMTSSSGRKTRVGVIMELTDAFRDSYPESLKREETKVFYKEQIDKMSSLVGNDAVDFSYYLGTKEWYNNESRMLDCVNNFYGGANESGSVALCMQ